MSILPARHDKQAAAVVNHLIEVCNERASGYIKAAEELKDKELQNIFREISEQTNGMSKQLLSYIHDSKSHHDGTSASSEAWEYWIAIKGAITQGSRKAMLDACLTGEEFAIHNYEKATQKNLPLDLKEIINAQLSQIKNSARNLKAIKNTIIETEHN